MKALKDDRVLIGIGLLFFGIAFIDQAMTKADNLRELSIIGKTSCAIMGAILAWFVIKYMIIGLILYVIDGLIHFTIFYLIWDALHQEHIHPVNMNMPKLFHRQFQDCRT